MMLPSGCLLTILFIFMRFHYGHTKIADRTSDKQDWDVLIFTQYWPRTGCEEWMDRDTSNKCSMPRYPNSWSIHGIWPTKFGTFGPFYCNRSAQFDREIVKLIEKKLTEVWSTYKYGAPDHSLWAHEWIKHGTCATEYFNTELKYFTRGIEYHKTYNISKILREADIVPSFSKVYDVLDIVNAIRFRLGANPIVKCRRNSKSNLFEIGICFSKELRICDCDGIMHARVIGTSNILTNCDRNQPVLYLPYNSFSNI